MGWAGRTRGKVCFESKVKSRSMDGKSGDDGREKVYMGGMIRV